MLLATVVAIVGYGLWAIDGITKLDVTGDPDYYVKRQAAYALLGAVGLIVALLIDPQLYRRHSKIVFAALIAMLLLVPVIGVEVRNTRRWIELGAFQFQPSEFGKLLVILFLAAFLADRGKRIADGRTVLTATGLAFVPMSLVFWQPDLGTAVVYAAALWATLFVAGTRWVHLSALLGVAALVAVVVLWAAPAAGVQILADYQHDRLTGFLTPRRTPRDRPTTSRSRRRPWARAGSTGAGSREPRRRAGTTSRSITRTSSSPRSPSSAGSSECRSCCSSICS